MLCNKSLKPMVAFLSVILWIVVWYEVYDNIIKLMFFYLTQLTSYFYVEKIAHFSFTHKEINNTIPLQPSGCYWSIFGILCSLPWLLIKIKNS